MSFFPPRTLSAACMIWLFARAPASASTALPEQPAPQAPPDLPAAVAPASPPPAARTPAPATPPAPAAVPAAMPTLPPGYVYAAPGSLPIMVVQAPDEDALDPTRRALNAVYVELGGNGITYSLNYERFLTPDLSARVGLGYFAVGDAALAGASASLTTVPVMLNYLGIGRYNHRLELGVGLVVLHMSSQVIDGFGSDFGSGTLVAGTGCIAYRYAPLHGGFNFKAGLTPIVASFGVFPSAGVSLGALF
jgi:hypothetical protein